MVMTNVHFVIMFSFVAANWGAVEYLSHDQEILKIIYILQAKVQLLIFKPHRKLNIST